MRISDWSSDVCSSDLAYRVIRDALRSTRKVGIGQLVLRGRESIVALKPCGDGLMMETLRFADEVRNAAPRSEERRVGKECGSTVRSGWSQSHSKKKPTT